MAATMHPSLKAALALFACSGLMLVLLVAYQAGQSRCEHTRAQHPAATDTHVNGAC